MSTPLYIRGMHGIGDNLHQRAVVRLLKQRASITLETSWASLYHDFIDDRFRVVGRPINLRTQLKNFQRERTLFTDPPPHHHVTHSMRLAYSAGTIAATKSGTITEALFALAGLGDRFAEADFRLPIKPEWLDTAKCIMDAWSDQRRGRPIMIYRPLCHRPEWMGSVVRNANVEDYRTIADALHEKFFIVSIADLEPTKEWIVGPEFPADRVYHRGEFPFEILAAIFRRADLIVTSGGFAAMLGPAVETPTISVLGGYEPAAWCGDGAKFSSYLPIEPMRPCRCGSSGCQNHCTKKLDMPAALAAVQAFTSMIEAAPC